MAEEQAWLRGGSSTTEQMLNLRVLGDKYDTNKIYSMSSLTLKLNVGNITSDTHQ